MTSIINGLNFRRNFHNNHNNNEVAKIDVEEALRLRKQRILDKESENNNETLIKALCDVKLTFTQSKYKVAKNTGMQNCSCWYMYNEFLNKDIQESIEGDGCQEINIFNKVIMDRFCSFLQQGKSLGKFSDPVTWEMFYENDSVHRLIFDESEKECCDIMDEDKLKKVASDKLNILKQYFDYFSTQCNEYFLNFVSSMCRKSISTFNINGFDLALLHSLQTQDQNLKANNDKRPIIYIIRCRCSIDYLLVPLLFKEAGIDQPMCIVGESPLILNMRSILSRLGYLVMRKEEEMKCPKLQSFVVDKKISMILEAQKSICLVLNDSLNSYAASIGEQTEIKVLTSVINSYVDGKLNDPLLVPLSFCHEYIPNAFLTTSSWLPNSWMFLNMMSGQFGVVKLSICKPIYYSQCAGGSGGYNEVVVTDPKSKISNLIKHFSWFGTESQLVMPTNMVAFLILYYYKGEVSISVEELARTAIDLIKDILPSDVLAFQESSMLTIIRRGCNVLGHLLTISEDRNNKSQFNVSFDYQDYSKISELDVYADVVVNQILMKAVAATAFVSIIQLTPSMNYTNQLTATSHSMNDAISNIIKLLLSRNFQYLLPCKSLDGEISKINNWWNEAMITSTRATDSMFIDNDYNNKDYKKISDENTDWRADVYDTRVRSQIMLLSNCLAPRLEALSFLVTELMINKQIGFDSMTLCSELYQNFVKSIKQAAKLNRLRFKNSMKREYFVSALINLNTHEVLKVMDLSTRSWMVLASDFDVFSTRYAVLDSEYYNLHRWKSFIDVSLVAA